MRFTGKVAVVTGGASGIGAASVRRFHAEGASVVIADLNDDWGETLAAELGERTCYLRTDVAAWPEVERLMQHAVARFGRLDILFNNAGIGGRGPVPDLAVADWHRIIAVDLDSVFYGCKAAIPLLRAHGGGAIINTASISGLRGDYAMAAYNAAKGAVINLTRSMAIEHARENIRINAICPGPVDTPIIARAKEIPGMRETWDDSVPLGRFARPEEIAAVAAFLASDDASFMIGVALPVDGGLTAHTGQPNLTKWLADMPPG